jgi:FKBP-type peptidyl-prolyl cis-trans isomerase
LPPTFIDSRPSSQPRITCPVPTAKLSGCLVKDEVVGTGPEPKAGQTVDVHYTGWLDDKGKRGRKFDRAPRAP